MPANLLTWLVLLAVAIFFGWLVTRAWRARRWFIRWPGVLLSGLLTLLVALLTVLGAIGLVKVYAPAGGPIQNLQLQAAPEKIQRGAHIAEVFCVDCHAPEGQTALVGGVNLAKDIPMPVGSLVSVNLTTGGPLKNWSDGQILRILREGVDPSGRKLMVMKSVNVRYMSDEDLQAVIAYMRSLPADNNPTPHPPDQLNLLGVMMFGSGLVPDLAPVTGPITAPPKAATVEYGKYILSFQDCRSCHGMDLNGGTSKISPNGPPLRLVKGWSQAQFITTLRTGTNPDGHQLQSPMPWKSIGKMDDVELEAIYKYLTSLW